MDIKNNNVKEYWNRIIRQIEHKTATIQTDHKPATIKPKRKHKSLGKEIPPSTKIGICIKILKKYDAEYEKDENVDYYYDMIPMSYNMDRYCYYRTMKYYVKQLFIFLKTIIIHPGESLYILLEEDPNDPINGIVNKECTQFGIKVKNMYRKDMPKGDPYLILTENSNKGLEKTQKLVELYDLDLLKKDIDKVSSNVVIKITNKLYVDMMIKGKDEIEKENSKPYEFWIYLAKTDSTEYRKKLISKVFRGKPHIIPVEECKTRPNKIKRLSKISNIKE